MLIPVTIYARIYTPPITIMLDPAGDAKTTGRTIQDSLERSITLQYAEEIKKILTNRNPHMRVSITRQPGEIIYPLQQASFANRMQPDLYININFYHEAGTKPHIYIYHFSYGDDFITHTHGLALYPYDQAHLFSRKKTLAYGIHMCNILKQPAYDKLFTVHGPYSLPFKPLIGIIAPAIGIEISIKNKDDWHSYVEPLVESIEFITKGIL